MIIDELLREIQMSRYKLSKTSGVAQATISDICSGKTSMEKCSAGTLYKIAKVLNVTVDALLEADEQEMAQNLEYRCSFETFKSNTCHHVKDMGDIVVLQELLKSKPIAAGRLAANNNLLHFRLIHEFLCPPKESKKSHAGVTKLKYSSGKFKSPPVKCSAEVRL